MRRKHQETNNWQPQVTPKKTKTYHSSDTATAKKPQSQSSLKTLLAEFKKDLEQTNATVKAMRTDAEEKLSRDLEQLKKRHKKNSKRRERTWNTYVKTRDTKPIKQSIKDLHANTANAQVAIVDAMERESKARQEVNTLKQAFERTVNLQR